VAVLLGEHRLERCLAAARPGRRNGSLRHRFRRCAGGLSELGARTRSRARVRRARGCSTAWGLPPEPSVRQARRALAEHGVEMPAEGDLPEPRRLARKAPVALGCRDVWGRAGAGEERTRHCGGRSGDQARRAGGADGEQWGRQEHAAARRRGLVEPQRGRVEARGGVGAPAQRPGYLFVHERVGDELHGADGDEASGASAWRR